MTRPHTPRTILVEIALGELIDKITILQIKSVRIHDSAKLVNILRERQVLETALAAAVVPSAALTELTEELRSVNETLWQIEDDIRLYERAGDFGPRFIELARSVYRRNDLRAALKRRINELVGSALVEEKSYSDYSQPPEGR